MIYISHRGNLDGKNLSLENDPSYILEAINCGFDVELDLFKIHDDLYLGHDHPQYRVTLDFLEKYKEKLWIHCKNHDAIIFLNSLNFLHYDFNYFWHENDQCTLTSKGFIWAFPGCEIEKSICVLPEQTAEKIDNKIGICSDFIIGYKY